MSPKDLDPDHVEHFDISDLDITPSDLRPIGKLRDPKETAAELDHAALLVVGQRLAIIEDRLGHIEMRLGNIENSLALILSILKG